MRGDDHDDDDVASMCTGDDMRACDASPRAPGRRDGSRWLDICTDEDEWCHFQDGLLPLLLPVLLPAADSLSASQQARTDPASLSSLPWTFCLEEAGRIGQPTSGDNKDARRGQGATWSADQSTGRSRDYERDCKTAPACVPPVPLRWARAGWQRYDPNRFATHGYIDALMEARECCEAFVAVVCKATGRVELLLDFFFFNRGDGHNHRVAVFNLPVDGARARSRYCAALGALDAQHRVQHRPHLGGAASCDNNGNNHDDDVRETFGSEASGGAPAQSLDVGLQLFAVAPLCGLICDYLGLDSALCCADDDGRTVALSPGTALYAPLGRSPDRANGNDRSGERQRAESGGGADFAKRARQDSDLARLCALMVATPNESAASHISELPTKYAALDFAAGVDLTEEFGTFDAWMCYDPAPRRRPCEQHRPREECI